MIEDKDNIFVTRPSLPALDDFIPYLEKIWETRRLTNMGPFHDQLEREIEKYLGVKHVSLVVNGTIALMLALKALDITGEVITTPFSFVATSHVLLWSNIKPVFVDIESEYLNINPEKIRSAITKNTTAIMPVHVFGNPCNYEQLKQISKDNNLKLIYDASHAFGVKLNNSSILNFGDLSILSFHATKTFNTFEGGAIISGSKKLKDKIDKLRNYGFINETTVEGIGINGKLNEFQSALGLMQLKYFDKQVEQRKKIVEIYKRALKNVNGIAFIPEIKGLENNYSFLPIIVNTRYFGKTRDYLCDELKKHRIFPRRYFYPLISEFPIYNKLSSASRENLPIASKISRMILCLPIYPDLEYDTILKITEIVKDSSL